MTETTETTIHSLAAEAASWFERRTRDDGETFVCLKDDRPEWVLDLTMSAHGDFLPEDWRYATIEAALDFIHDTEADEDDSPHEFADGHVDVYTGSRLAWLSSHLTRPAYVDEAREEGLIGPDTDIVEAIGVGQYMESLEVYRLVWEALSERLEAVEDETTDED
jgi:hypothetical protein